MNWIAALIRSAHAGNSFMPPQGTVVAVEYDRLYAFIVWASFISCAILIGGMIYFALKYKRRTNNDKTAYISHNAFLEFLWSFVPLVIFVVVFAWGWSVYHKMRTFPNDSLEVHVVAKQWAWDFQYKSGKVTTNEFVVPAKVPVKLIMSSKDVLHSFYIPSMRIKQDIIPGRYTALGFNADKTGEYQVFCTEYCGTAHSSMLAKMKVVPLEEYEKWLQEKEEGLSLAQKGEKLFNSKGCVACHSTDGSAKVGPTWKGLWGAARELADGSKASADENYLREAIVSPNAKVVKGFAAGIMPTFQGQVTEDEMTAFIEYIKGLK